MDNIIHDLWYNYSLEKSKSSGSEQEKKLISQITKNEEILLSELSSEQIRILENFVEDINSLNSISTEHAYFSGIRFATTFIIEAFLKE